MSIAVSSTANYLERTTDLPATGKFTFMCWVRWDSLSVTEPLFARAQASGSSFFLFKNSTDVIAHRIGGDAASLGSTSLSADTWYHVALTRDDDPATPEHDIYLNGAKEIDNDTATTWAEDAIQLGRNKRFGSQMNGEIAAVKIWSGVILSQAQIQQEMWQYLPIHAFGNLHIVSPFVDQVDTQFTDYSGNGRNWSEAGTVTIDDNPPVAWGALPYVVTVSPPAGGATPYYYQHLIGQV